MPYRAVFARQSVIYAHPPRATPREWAVSHGGAMSKNNPLTIPCCATCPTTSSAVHEAVAPASPAFARASTPATGIASATTGALPVIANRPLPCSGGIFLT